MKTKKKPTKALAKKVTAPDVSAKIVLASIQKEAGPLIKKLNKVTIITSQEDYDNAALAMSVLKQYGKQSETKKKELLDPLKVVQDGIKELFKPFEIEVVTFESRIKRLMVDYRSKQAVLQEKVLEDFESGKIKKVATVLQKQAVMAVTKNANSQVRKVWTLTIIDERKIPHHLMIPNEAAIREAWKDGHQVEGTSWEQVETVAI